MCVHAYMCTCVLLAITRVDVQVCCIKSLVVVSDNSSASFSLMMLVKYLFKSVVFLSL